MNIQDMNIQDIKIGDEVTYIGYRKFESGYVTSKNDTNVFVRYKKSNTSQSTNPRDLIRGNWQEELNFILSAIEHDSFDFRDFKIKDYDPPKCIDFKILNNSYRIVLNNITDVYTHTHLYIMDRYGKVEKKISYDQFLRNYKIDKLQLS